MTKTSDPDNRTGGHGRRRFLAGAAAATAVTAVVPRAFADASVYRDRFQAFRQTFRVEPDPEEAWRMVSNVVGERTPREDLITLITPDIAENGAVVPVTVKIECAMTEDDYPVRAHIVVIDNPFPEIAKFHFTPDQGEAEVNLRIRMRRTSYVVAMADMSDGTVGVTKRLVNVTLGACS